MTKVNDLLIKTRMRIKDPGGINYSTYELLDYFHDASDFLSMELITLRDSEMVREFQQEIGKALPDDFVEFAGQHPLYQQNGVVQAHDSSQTKMEIRYFAKKPHVLIAENSPFATMYDMVLVQLTVIYALGRDTGGMPQDENMLNQVRQSIAAIKKQQQQAAQ